MDTPATPQTKLWVVGGKGAAWLHCGHSPTETGGVIASSCPHRGVRPHSYKQAHSSRSSLGTALSMAEGLGPTPEADEASTFSFSPTHSKAWVQTHNAV